MVDSPPAGGEPTAEKSKTVRKPKQPAAPPDGGAAQPPIIARVSRAARREELYQSLASNALP